MYIKEKAYNFLISYRITNLNFNIELLTEIAILNKWELCKYSSNQKLIYNLNLKEQLKLDAFTFIKENKIFILYNDDLPENDILFNILYEFGHILLKHSSSNNIMGSSLIKENLIRQENEANTFACEVLAPSCIFKEMEVYSIDDIIRLSKLPIKHITQHIPNITNFHSLDDISERLIKIFNEYIKKNKYDNEETKINPKVNKSYLKFFTVSSILTICLIFILISLKNNNISNNSMINNTAPITSIETITNDKVFYTTKTGTKYHLKDCRYIKDKNNLIQLNFNDDNFKKYEPCSICIK
ncbi:ImmA/IrrE family metallo-endopeptidase [[Clostridium] colinum]|uniref:ImmA/IrrE family metallo-endopeptidase n=1 Tax=[Clostridium] colinum TaxID=36835 RepID=UPI002023F6B0|nr:ImmA/IrrE family metallo-endopeptidase [[Clostridium] colinum]